MNYITFAFRFAMIAVFFLVLTSIFDIVMSLLPASSVTLSLPSTLNSVFHVSDIIGLWLSSAALKIIISKLTS